MRNRIAHGYFDINLEVVWDTVQYGLPALKIQRKKARLDFSHPIESDTAMNQTAETLSAQAVQLPPEDRLALVERILDSLDEPDASMDALWAKEADDRPAVYRRGEIRAPGLVRRDRQIPSCQ